MSIELIDSEGCIPYNDLLKEMFDNRNNASHLVALREYVELRKKDYCLVHAKSLWFTVNGYIQNLKPTNK